MNSRIIRRRRAVQDLINLAEFIALDNLQASDRFLSAVERNLRLLAGMPLMGRAWRSPLKKLAGTRVWVIPEFRNYLLFYRPLPDGIELLHIFHAARDVASILEADTED